MLGAPLALLMAAAAAGGAPASSASPDAAPPVDLAPWRTNPGVMLALADEVVEAAPVASEAAAAPGADAELLVAAPVPLGEDVPPKLAEKTAQLLAAQLRSLGRAVMAEEKVREIREGSTAAERPDLGAAADALKRGQDAYLGFDLDGAVAALEDARKAYAAALAQTGEIGPLAESLAYLGASYLSRGDPGAAEQAFLEILRRRPKHTLDERVHPPQVIGAFEKARQKAAALPRGRLSIASAPPLATVTVDGVRRGETPVTLEQVPVGLHALRVEAAGHHPHWEEVDLTASGAELTIRLRPATAADDLQSLETEAAGEGGRKLMLEQGGSLARGAALAGVVVVALARAGEDWAVSAALIGPDRTASIAWTVVDRDFLRAQAALSALAGKLVSEPGPVFADAGLPAPELELDFEDRLLGLTAPEPVAAPGEEPKKRSIFARWWFWAGLVVLGAAGGAGYYYLQPPVEVPGPNTVGFDVEVLR